MRHNKIRGFITEPNGITYPDVYEQKIDLYVCSLQYTFRNIVKTLSMLNESGILNPGRDDGVWTKCAVRSCVQSCTRIGHLPFERKKGHRIFLNDVLNFNEQEQDDIRLQYSCLTADKTRMGRFSEKNYNMI